MKTLMVSFNRGITYEPFMKSDDVNELVKRTEKRDAPDKDISFTRWYIEDEGGEMDVDIQCPVHKHIFGLLNTLNSLNQREENP